MALVKQQSLLPLFSFPTKVVIVDDNVELLKSMELLSENYGIELIPFNDPRKALAYLQKITFCDFTKKYLTPEENTEIFYSEINLHLNNLHQEVYNKARFNEVSALVIDYAMPGMNGQEFCQQIANSAIKKLLLTGEATYEKAAEMFNEGIIDLFVKKSDDNDYDSLFLLIKMLQKKYFQSFTKDLLFVLKNSTGKSIFSDEKFIDFFDNLIKNQQIVEYYVVDNSGSYLLINKLGEAKLLIVKPEEDMQVLYELAEGDDDISDSNSRHIKKVSSSNDLSRQLI